MGRRERVEGGQRRIGSGGEGLWRVWRVRGRRVGRAMGGGVCNGS